jgi:hypothetical protein
MSKNALTISNLSANQAASSNATAATEVDDGLGDIGSVYMHLCLYICMNMNIYVECIVYIYDYVYIYAYIYR